MATRLLRSREAASRRARETAVRHLRAGERGLNALCVAVGVAAMACFLLSGVALLAHVLQPESFVTLSMVAAALLLCSIAKLETGPPGSSRTGPSA